MALTLPFPLGGDSLPEQQINGSLFIEVSFSSRIQQGADGDIYAGFPVTVGFTATAETFQVQAAFGAIDVNLAATGISADTYTSVAVDAELPDLIIVTALNRGAYGNLDLGKLNLFGVATIGRAASGELELELDLSGTASAGYVTGSEGVPLELDLALAGIGTVSAVGKGVLALNIKLVGRGASGALGTGSIDFSDLAIEATSYQGASGTGSLPINLMLSGIALIDSYECLVMNTKNFALTEFDFELNGLVCFNGIYFGASPTSLFELTGDDDDDEIIEWHFKTGKLNLEKDFIERLRHVWLSYKPDGDTILTVDDGTNEYEYMVYANDIINSTVRVKTGKGIRAKYADFKLRNVSGESIFLDRMRLFTEKVRKKR